MEPRRANMAPRWVNMVPRWANMAPRWATWGQDGPTWLPFWKVLGSKWANLAPRWAELAPRGLKTPQEGQEDQFGTHFGQIFDNFLKTLYRFLEHILDQQYKHVVHGPYGARGFAAQPQRSAYSGGDSRPNWLLGNGWPFRKS